MLTLNLHHHLFPLSLQATRVIIHSDVWPWTEKSASLCKAVHIHRDLLLENYRNTAPH